MFKFMHDIYLGKVPNFWRRLGQEAILQPQREILFFSFSKFCLPTSSSAPPQRTETPRWFRRETEPESEGRWSSLSLSPVSRLLSLAGHLLAGGGGCEVRPLWEPRPPPDRPLDGELQPQEDSHSDIRLAPFQTLVPGEVGFCKFSESFSFHC